MSLQCSTADTVYTCVCGALIKHSVCFCGDTSGAQAWEPHSQSAASLTANAPRWGAEGRGDGVPGAPLYPQLRVVHGGEAC